MEDVARKVAHAFAICSAVFVALVAATYAGRSLDGDEGVIFTSDTVLGQSVSYGSLPRKERQEMQQEILSLLGLHHRPAPTSHETRAAAPRYMMNLYKSLSDEDLLEAVSSQTVDSNLPSDEDGTAAEAKSDSGKDEVHDADVIMSFVNHSHDKKSKHDGWRRGHMRHDGDRRLWFDVSEVSPAQDIIAAHLRLYRRPKNDKILSDQNYTVNVFQIIEGSGSGERELKKLNSLEVSSGQAEGWMTLNVTSAVSDWVIYPHNNLGLFVSVHVVDRERSVSPTKVGIVGHKGPDNRQAFMTALFKTPTALHVRNTRAARRRQKKQSSSYSDDLGFNPYANFHDRHSRRSCHKKTLYVSFRDLKWQDWIIAPDGYAAFYCNGECSFPLNAHMNATNHAIVQTLVHLMNPYTVPKPCCAPTKLSAISVLYFDDNSNVILKKYKNMVVKSCGCH